jgi:hypothetical protein
MQVSKKKAEPGLPCVQITTRDVISFCKEHSQTPAAKVARQWLLDHKRAIEREMREAIKEEIPNILDHVLFGGYVDPARDAHYQDFDGAVNAAMDDYAAKHGMELHGFSYHEKHISELLEHLLANPLEFRGCLEYNIDFCPRDAATTEENIRRFNRVHVIRESGSLRAEVIGTDKCVHDDYVIVPVNHSK